MADPRKPTEKEVVLHNLTHLPYRNLCPARVAAKGIDLDHRKDVKGEIGLPEFSFDACFPGNELGVQADHLGREGADFGNDHGHSGAREGQQGQGVPIPPKKELFR